MMRKRAIQEDDDDDEIQPASQSSSSQSASRRSSSSSSVRSQKPPPSSQKSSKGKFKSSAVEDRDRSEEEESESEEEETGTKNSKKMSLSKAEIKLKVAEVVRYCIIANKKKTPIRRLDISKEIMKDCPPAQTNEVIVEARETLKEIFGLELVAVQDTVDEETSISSSQMPASQAPSQQASSQAPSQPSARSLGKTFILLNALQVEGYNEKIVNWELDAPKRGLLMVILAIIYIQGNTVDNNILWQTLGMLGMARGREHPIFGDPEKLINTEFCRQLYLHRQKGSVDIETGHVSYEYSWGPRAKTEIKHESLLNFIAIVFNISLESLKKELQAESD